MEKEQDGYKVRMELSWAAALGSSRPQQKSWSGEERQKERGEEREREKKGEIRKDAHNR